MARSLFCLSVKPIALTKFVGTGLSYTTTTLTLPSLHLLPSATTASNTTHHLRTSTSRTSTYLSLLSTLSLSLSYILSPRGKQHPFLIYAALTTALPLGWDAWTAYVAPAPARTAAGGNDDGRISMRDATTTITGRKCSSSSSSSAAASSDDIEEWEVEASGMRASSGSGGSTAKAGGGGSGGGGVGVRTPPEDSSSSDDVEGEVNGESVREGMRSWGQGVARRGLLWGVGFATAVVGLWGDGV